MRKIIIFFLPFLLLGCTNESDMPILEIAGIYIEGDEDEINYVNKLDRMPALTKGDKVDILFILDGNGEELGSFVVKSENENVKTPMWFQVDEVSSELSEITEGILVFIDGVYLTGLTVKAEITEEMEGEQLLSFYLSSKASDSEAAEVKLNLPTAIEEPAD